ncbi:hypothetical protein, partial [Actinomyces sp.]|uniref:hypothetical protein n=1 Tax=Actinomyces sp. TaxID=29317 RepID=UPI00360B8D95
VGCWSVMRTPWWFPVTGGDVSATSGACLAPAVAARLRAAAWVAAPGVGGGPAAGGGEVSWR